MLLDSLYHPPLIVADPDKTTDESLYMVHRFEGKQLIRDFIPEVLVALSFLWGGEVNLETTDIVVNKNAETEADMYSFQRVLFTCIDKNVTKTKL
jgi:stage V sporulation protein R